MGSAVGTHVLLSPILLPVLAHALHAPTVGAGNVVGAAAQLYDVVWVLCCACCQVSEPASPTGQAADCAMVCVCVAVLGAGHAWHPPLVEVTCGDPHEGDDVAAAQVEYSVVPSMIWPH